MKRKQSDLRISRLRSLRRINEYLGARSRSTVVMSGLACVGALAAIDFLTGYEVSFALFYVLPISFVAWYAGWMPAILVSIASAVAWEEANRLAGQTYSSLVIPFWNATMRLGFFLIIAALFWRVRQMYEREQTLARMDSLTGVNNRRAFEEVSQTEIARAHRTAHPLTVVYIDLDDFKLINDRLGHDTGNKLLCLVAKTLRSNFRITDTVARLGGDEFAVLLPETKADVAKTLIAKNHRMLLDEMRQHEWPVGFSIGVLTCLEPPETVDAMLKIVDELMYGVKKSGKNAANFSVYPG